MKLKNRVAIITGAARGIGKAIALTLRQGRGKGRSRRFDKERLEALKNEMEKRKGEAITISCDITKSSEVKGMVDQVHKSIWPD